MNGIYLFYCKQTPLQLAAIGTLILLPPNAINLVKSEIVSLGLTHSHTMTPFDASGKQAF